MEMPDPHAVDQLSGIGATGATALAVNALHSWSNSALGKKIFHKTRFYVKPLFLMVGTVGCGVISALTSGMDWRTAAVGSFVGLIASVTGPAWKGVWEEAAQEFEEEEKTPVPGDKA